jgi:hypothetical protein
MAAQLSRCGLKTTYKLNFKMKFFYENHIREYGSDKQNSDEDDYMQLSSPPWGGTHT